MHCTHTLLCGLEVEKALKVKVHHNHSMLPINGYCMMASVCTMLEREGNTIM
jgi:hypothetical protein